MLKKMVLQKVYNNYIFVLFIFFNILNTKVKYFTFYLFTKNYFNYF